MDAARAAVSKITGNRGHQTSVEETVAPSVTHEAVKPHRHEETTQAVDREVHQHHHHTTVQPLQHQETLPEKHSHNILPQEHREFRHDNESATKERLATDLAKFKDQSITHETRHTQQAAPTVTGEHVHHHVHETVVPVVHKETIQPEVVHTTVPVHETHHAAAQHHGLSALPMKSLDEFKQSGGILTGGQHSSHEQYEGAPRPYNDKLSTTFEKLEEKFTPSHHTTGGHTSGTTGVTGTTGLNKSHHAHDSGIGGVGGVGNEFSSNQGVGRETSHLGQSTGMGGNHLGQSTGTDGQLGQRGAGPMGTTEGTRGTPAGQKPSLMDRMNPRVDADGDGKKGLMD